MQSERPGLRRLATPLLLVALAAATPGAAQTLPPPDFSPPPQNHARVVGWPQGQAPRAPAGFVVEVYADHFANPRWLHVLPNGDVLVAEANQPPKPDERESPERLRMLTEAGVRGDSPNRIVLLRDANRDGHPEMRETFLAGLNQPFGMALLNDQLYVANTNALVRYPYRTGATRLDEAAGVTVLDLPAGGYNNHWTRNVVARPDGAKLYVTVGSATNVDEEREDERDPLRAAVTELNPDGTGARVFAGGLRNPNGLAFEPRTGALWAAVNERDLIGDDLVPDYVTSVRDGAFYGWPYAYQGPNEEPRKRGERPDLVRRTIPFDLPLGAHTATMDLKFYTGATFPAAYRDGLFVSQRGSWNRSRPSGYRVLFVPFADGRPSGPPRDFLTGFVAATSGADGTGRPSVHGRPVGLAQLPDGSLLIADDGADRIWRVRYAGAADAPLPAAADLGLVGRPPVALPVDAGRRVALLDATHGLRTPESAAHDPAEDAWFVSNMNAVSPGETWRRDNNGFITRVSADGRVERLRLAAGGERGLILHAPKGVAVVGDTLWVADIDAVVALDKRSGALRRRVDLAPLGARWLNDVALGPDGAIYVTDQGLQWDAAGRRHVGPDRIWRLGADGASSIACTFDSAKLSEPNGLAYDARERRFLVVATGAGRETVWTFTPGERCAAQAVAAGPGTHDGLAVLGDGRILVGSHGNRTVSLVSPGAPATPVAIGLPYPGDFSFDSRRGRIAVPLVRNDRLEFWQLPLNQARNAHDNNERR